MSDKFTDLERDLLIFYGVDPDEEAAIGVMKAANMLSESLKNLHHVQGQEFWLYLAFNFVEMQGRLDAATKDLKLILDFHAPAETDTIH